MKEYTTPLGHKIYVFEKVIPKEICKSLISYVSSGDRKGKIIDDKNKPKELFHLYKSYCKDSPVEFIGYSENYTAGASNEPIPYHTDTLFNNSDFWKILFYLNDVPDGGTIFREENQDISIENSEGTVVLFDIRIPHLGNPKQKGMKYTIGFRPISNSGNRIQMRPLYSRFRRH